MWGSLNCQAAPFLIRKNIDLFCALNMYLSHAGQNNLCTSIGVPNRWYGAMFIHSVAEISQKYRLKHRKNTDRIATKIPIAFCPLDINVYFCIVKRISDEVLE